jgi:hypothetical protein
MTALNKYVAIALEIEALVNKHDLTVNDVLTVYCCAIGSCIATNVQPEHREKLIEVLPTSVKKYVDAVDKAILLKSAKA